MLENESIHLLFYYFRINCLIENKKDHSERSKQSKFHAYEVNTDRKNSFFQKIRDVLCTCSKSSRI